jgi:diamine N-acetyltransferase
VIRLATPEDASSLAALSLEVWLNTYIREGINAFFANYALKKFTAARFAKIMSDQNETIWVSQNAVGIDGFIRMSLGSIAPVDACSDMEISTLYVQPRHQGNGAGRRLLQTGLKFCADAGRPNVWLAVNAENEQATHFYIRNGFEKAGETNFQIGDQAYPNHILRASL